MGDDYHGPENRVNDRFYHAIMEKLHSIHDDVTGLKKDMTYSKEEVERSRMMHKQHYDNIAQTLEKVGANSRVLGILEASFEAHKKDYADHVSSRWKIGTMLLTLMALISGGATWLVDHLRIK